MRIIAGSARGRPLIAPKGDATRPTLDRVKESLFSILQYSVPDARVLDLYAGSGNLALEALSRGAAYAVLNDHCKVCCDVIQKNLAALSLSDRAMVMQLNALDAIDRLAQQPPFDIIFLDPPYRDGAQAVLEKLFQKGLPSMNGRVILEHGWAHCPEAVPGLMLRVDRRRYGDTGLSFFERIPNT